VRARSEGMSRARYGGEQARDERAIVGSAAAKRREVLFTSTYALLSC